MAVPDDEFETMRARTRSYRKRLAELGSVGEPVIVGYVRDHLRSRRPEPLPPAQADLADEIVAFLEEPQLSAHQAALLEREFFGGS